MHKKPRQPRNNKRDAGSRDGGSHPKEGQQSKRRKYGQPIIPTVKLRGRPVLNEEGEHLGKLSDLMVETNRGTIAYVILTFDNDRSLALPYSMLQIDPKSLTIRTNVQREVIELGHGMFPQKPKEGD